MTVTTLEPVGVEGVDQKSLLVTSPGTDGTSVAEDLEGWLNHGHEESCDSFLGDTERCPNIATWIEYLVRGCQSSLIQRFSCDECHECVVGSSMACRSCMLAGQPADWLTLAYAERVR